MRNNYIEKAKANLKHTEIFVDIAESKLSAVLKGQVTLENKTVSAADFNKMFE